MGDWIAPIVCLAVTCSTVPIVRRWLISREIVDRPNRRSSHNSVIPRGGGLACIAGIAGGVVVLATTGRPVPWVALLATLLIALVGAVDDRRSLSPVPRLAAQVLAGLLLGAYYGGLPGAIAGAALAPLLVNVVNFVDGINGITGLLMATWASMAALVAFSFGATDLATLALLTLAAALGFLPWNMPRAQLFLGDVGSYLFGMLATTGIVVGGASDIPTMLLLAPLAPAIFDVGYTLARRALKRAPLLQAHREHIYQRIVQTSSLPHVAVALIAASFAGLFATAALIDDRLLLASAPVLLALYASTPRILSTSRKRRSNSATKGARE